MINDLAKYKVFSSLNLKSTYHQVPLKVSDRKYTAFEVNGHLFKFCRIPFRSQKRSCCIPESHRQNNPERKFMWCFSLLLLQDVHDQNVKKFLEAIAKADITFNKLKSGTSVRSINILGYHINGGIIKPDPERLHSLKELPPQKNSKSAKRAFGMFAYYAKLIYNFSTTNRKHKIPT